MYVPACGKLTLPVLPEEENAVAKPDLISVCADACHTSSTSHESRDKGTNAVTSPDTVTREFLCLINAFTLKSLLVGRDLPVPRGI